MLRRLCCGALVSAAALLAVSVASLVEARAPATDTEEFVGPFASWRQVTCSGRDDTAHLQRELDKLGTSNNSPVLYLRPGTCVITSTLRIEHKEGVTILGADPAQVTIRWAGPNGGEMVHVDGVAYSRFGRITWDGGGSAGVVYRLQWDGRNPFFPTGNRHEDEVFINADFGIRAGNGGAGGEAETTVVRCTFRNLRLAGINLEDWNSLDWWIFQSRFENTNNALTNNYFSGAGSFHVYDSVFLRNSGGDLTFTNTGLFSARRNWSSGSAHFLHGGPIGSAPALVSLQGNTIQNTTRASIVMYQPGPLLLVDNHFSTPGTWPLSMQEAYTSQPTGDVAAVGNTYDSQAPYDHVGGRVRSVDDVAGARWVSRSAPALPSTPRSLARPVFEPRRGDVQAAIDAAVRSGSPRAVVHLPYGTYSVGSTLVVPPGANLQIVGDGQTRSVLRAAGRGPVVLLKGPSHVVVRDLSVDGDRRADGIRLDNADQADGLFRADELTVKESRTGVLAGGLRHTQAEFTSFGAALNSGVALRARFGSRVSILGGAAAANNVGFEVAEASALTVMDMWYDGGATQHLAPGGSGTFTWDGGRLAGATDASLDGSTFDGAVNLVNQLATTEVKGGANTLALGLVATRGYWSADDAPWALWTSRTFLPGGGSQQATEQQHGVADADGYMRSHLAVLRSTKPVAPDGLASGVTDVRLIRVAISKAMTGLGVTGWRAQ